MNRRARIYQILALLSLYACAGTMADRPLVTHPSQVANFRDGTPIRARGYLIFESHARGLWPSAEVQRRGNIEDCFTLVNTLPHKQELQARNETIVTIVGRSFSDVLADRIDFGACSQVGVLVEAIE